MVISSRNIVILSKFRSTSLAMLAAHQLIVAVWMSKNEITPKISDPYRDRPFAGFAVAIINPPAANYGWIARLVHV
jgi:hypothetical protein